MGHLNLFLDSSVILAACRSNRGASRWILDNGSRHGWDLLTTPYAMSEVEANLRRVAGPGSEDWPLLRTRIRVVTDVAVLDVPTVFLKAKDRPILFAAYAWAEVLLTHDREDFLAMLGTQFYQLKIRTPRDFLREQRQEGTLQFDP
jgi:predicted nucleic acid-binding protein